MASIVFNQLHELILKDEEKEEHKRKQNAERCKKWRAKQNAENKEAYLQKNREQLKKWRTENEEHNKEQNRKHNFNYRLSK